MTNQNRCRAIVVIGTVKKNERSFCVALTSELTIKSPSIDCKLATNYDLRKHVD